MDKGKCGASASPFFPYLSLPVRYSLIRPSPGDEVRPAWRAWAEQAVLDGDRSEAGSQPRVAPPWPASRRVPWA